MSETLILNIDDMDCPTCAAPIEKAVCAIPGVIKARVNYVSGSIQVETNDDIEADVKTAITKLGYKIAGPRADGKRITAMPWYKTKKGRLVLFTGVLLILATLIFVFAKTVNLSAGPLDIKLYEIGFAIASLIALAPMAKKAVLSARAGSPFTIETLVTLAVIGAILIQQSAEAAIVVFLFAVGELLESVAAARARKNVEALADLAPKTANLVQGDAVVTAAAEDLKIDDIVEVRPGGRVPADGVIVEGETSLDESTVTGESIPVRRGVGQDVFAGTINTDGVIRLRVLKTAQNNMVARIMKLVEDAETAKSPTARFIDEFSRYYTPGVLVVALLVAIIPPLAFGLAWIPWVYKGLAILLIGCPCALVLSTPAAITSGIAAGARRGLLIKGGAVLEAIGRVRTIAFDKTGTLTAGKPKVTDVRVFNGELKDMLHFAAAVEATSSHPLAVAIVTEAKRQGVPVSRVTAAKALSGRGVQGQVDSHLITIASPRYAAELCDIPSEIHDDFAAFEKDGKTLGVVIKDKTLLGVFAMRDELRPDAISAMAKLKEMSIEVIMLTGDNERTGQAIAAQLGMQVKAELMPSDKLSAIEALKANGRVAMVGDGINDAPALARADIGVAMGGGTDVALETADAALLREQVAGIPALVTLSKATLRNIHQNIAFALVLKAVFLMTTLLGATSLWMAILADTGATVLVTLNALRLLRFDPYK